jgi:hypothetical protein
MAKQGAPHATMSEAFAKRLRQLYPEPPTLYLEGRVIKPAGLKPDIYVQHPDGRQWVFEMVHGNSSAQHLLKNHSRYMEHGIRDIWILWDSIRPTAGHERPLNQGVMPALLPEEKVYPLTAPQRAILEMQTDQTRYLHSFTVSPFQPQLDASAFLSAMMIGLDVYRFVGWGGQEKYVATCDFISLSELVFNDDGTPAFPAENMNEEVMRRTLQELGLNLDASFIPTAWLAQLNQSFGSPEGWRVLATASVVNRLISLPPEEIESVMDYLRSGAAAKLPPFTSDLTEADLSRVMDDPKLMSKIATESRRAKEYIASLDMPGPLKKLLVESIEEQGIAHAADMMRWQAESEVLRQTRSQP